ncbi:hypothetical protein D9M72_606770 [compost metagenome]
MLSITSIQTFMARWPRNSDALAAKAASFSLGSDAPLFLASLLSDGEARSVIHGPLGSNARRQRQLLFLRLKVVVVLGSGW